MLGELEGKIKKYFWREVLLGAVLSVVFGFMTFLIVLGWRQNYYLALVVGLALACTVILAVVIGLLIPLLFHWIHVDPAYASTPFVTTIKDITALMAYFAIVMAFIEFL